MTRAQTAVIAGDAAPAPKPPKDVREVQSKQAALAVLGGRFPGGVLEAIEHADFVGATEYYTRKHVKQLSLYPESVATAKSAERVRMQCALAGQLSDVIQLRDDPDYMEARTCELVGLAQAGAGSAMILSSGPRPLVPPVRGLLASQATSQQSGMLAGAGGAAVEALLRNLLLPS